MRNRKKTDKFKVNRTNNIHISFHNLCNNLFSYNNSNFNGTLHLHLTLQTILQESLILHYFLHHQILLISHLQLDLLFYLQLIPININHRYHKHN